MATTRTSVRPCPVCDRRTVVPIHTQSFALPTGHPLRDGYEVVCCDGCGTGFADTAATQADYDRFYAEQSKYEDAGTSTGGGTTPWDAERLRTTADYLARFIPRAARILDIECANGGLLRALADVGFDNLTGVDPSLACAANARKLVPAARIEVGWIDRPDPGFGQYDLVALTHVLEHVRDVGRAMTAVADGGRLYLEVPDAARYPEHVAAPFQDFNTEHINHFSQRSLASLAARHGFQAVETGTKTFLSPPPTPFPAAYGIFRKVGPDAVGPVELDAELPGRLREYVAASVGLMARINERLRAVVDRSPSVIVWGTGQLAMKLLTDSELKRAALAALIDGNPIHHGKQLAGVTICGPEAVAGLGHPIVIATTLHHKAIAAAIRDRYGYPNEIVTLAD